jgi:hypothetical protein
MLSKICSLLTRQLTLARCHVHCKVSLESALIRVVLHGTHIQPFTSRLQQPRFAATSDGDTMGSFLLVTLRKTGLVLGELGQSSVGDFSMLQVTFERCSIAFPYGLTVCYLVHRPTFRVDAWSSSVCALENVVLASRLILTSKWVMQR